MIEPENWWYNRPILADDEKIILAYPANHTQGYRAVGGKLFVTDQRLFFAPNRIDANLRGAPVNLPRASVVKIGTTKPHYSLFQVFSGAWRTRLQLHTKDGSRYCFVVNDLDNVLTQMESELFGDSQSATV